MWGVCLYSPRRLKGIFWILAHELRQPPEEWKGKLRLRNLEECIETVTQSIYMLRTDQLAF